MKLKTREKDYIFMIEGGKLIVLYDGKKEIVLVLSINDNKIMMKTEDECKREKYIKTSQIVSLDFSMDFVTKSEKVYKVRTCENHLLLFKDSELKGEIEKISSLKVGSHLEILLKRPNIRSLKFHI